VIWPVKARRLTERGLCEGCKGQYFLFGSYYVKLKPVPNEKVEVPSTAMVRNVIVAANIISHMTTVIIINDKWGSTEIVRGQQMYTQILSK
jgi:hypothetical protein